jgi:hypothetical protein
VFDPGASEESLQRGERPLLVDEFGTWKERWLAGSLPSWPRVNVEHSLYQPRNLDDSGRLFFDSADGLVGQDANGREDVYEFEPDGVGGCGLGQGCVGLISSGMSSEESAFIDASGAGAGGEEGEDVFFLTSSKLVAGDTDSVRDVYDAHECSAAVPCTSGVAVVPPACDTADSCRQAPMAQPSVFGAPASATFSGPGNPPAAAPVVKSTAQVRAEKLAAALKACRKKKHKAKRVACERRARRVYSQVGKAGKSSSVNKKSRAHKSSTADPSKHTGSGRRAG